MLRTASLTTGAYSKKFKQLEAERLRRLRENRGLPPEVESEVDVRAKVLRIQARNKKRCVLGFRMRSWVEEEEDEHEEEEDEEEEEEDEERKGRKGRRGRKETSCSSS